MAAADRPRIQLALSAGEIVIDLDPHAAPATVARIKQALSARSAQTEKLLIEQVWPQIEIATGVLLPSSDLVAQEIDAEALGLHQQLISTPGDAINVLQFELAKADARWKREGTRPALYQKWLNEFMETSVPTTMLGVSRKEINELLGYRYIDGASSHHPTAGAVYLRKVSPTENQLALTILLSDRPQLVGRVTIVGHVTQGLDLARSLSQVEVKMQYGRPTKTPLEPIEIVDIRLE